MISALAQPDRVDALVSAQSTPMPGQNTGQVFSGFLDRAYSEHQGTEVQLREAAEKLVSTTLLMPMFQRMRNDPLATNLFHGGRAESIFQQQLDQIYSDRIAGASGFDLVDSVYNEISRGAKGQAVNTHG